MGFDKNRFAHLLKKAKGNRSINRYASDSGVTSAHISRLLREKIETPPNPDTIKKLSNAAQNNVSYEDLMIAAGHIALTDEVSDQRKSIDLKDMIESNTVELTIYGRPLTDEQKEGLIKYIESQQEFKSEESTYIQNDPLVAHDESEEILILKPDLAELIKASQKINLMLQKFLEEKNKR